MTALPEKFAEAWEEKLPEVVLATSGANGIPEAVYVSCIKRYGDEKIVIADNYFHKTRANILGGSGGALLFMTIKGEAYQVKGEFEYITEGPIYEDMKTWLDPQYPGVAAVVLHVSEVYNGSERVL